MGESPWVTTPLSSTSPGYGQPFPQALATLIRRARARACLEGMPDTTRLRVTATRTVPGCAWLDGEPLAPAPGCTCTYAGPDESCPTHGRAACDATLEDWGPPPAGAPCTCRHNGPDGFTGPPDPECIQHGDCPDPEASR